MTVMLTARRQAVDFRDTVAAALQSKHPVVLPVGNLQLVASDA